jgi:hypothetical protein
MHLNVPGRIDEDRSVVVQEFRGQLSLLCGEFKLPVALVHGLHFTQQFHGVSLGL